MTNMLEWTSWSRHRKLYGFNKYVKNYEPRTVAAEVWQGVCVSVCTALYSINVSMCMSAWRVVVCLSNGVWWYFALCSVHIGLRVECLLCRRASESSVAYWMEWTITHTYQPEATGYLPLINPMWLPYASPVTWQGLFLIIFSLSNIGVKTWRPLSLDVYGHGWNNFLSCRAFYILLPWLLKWILKHFDVNVTLVVLKWNNMRHTCWYVFHSFISK